MKEENKAYSEGLKHHCRGYRYEEQNLDGRVDQEIDVEIPRVR